MEPLAVRILVALIATLVFGTLSAILGFRPRLVQRWVIGLSRFSIEYYVFPPLNRYVRSDAYITHLRVVSVGAAIMSLMTLYAFIRLLTQL